jgi:DNA end-binding protein Ku
MPHGIWKGTLGFGLVNIGVQLYAAEAPERLDLDLLDQRDHARIRYLKVNANTGREVKQADIVKGYPVEKGRYVILKDADIKTANPKATQSVDIVGFVPRDDVDLIYFAKPYYVGPLKGSEKAYALLREALRRTEQLAIAQIVIRTRQYVAAVYPQEEVLVVHLLRYHDELRDLKAAGVEAPKTSPRAIRPQELEMAEQLIKSMATTWDPTEYTDTFRRDILKLVKQRAKGGVRKAPEPEAPEERETRVLDLMAALKRSVESKGKAAPRGKRASRSRTTTRKSA